MQRLHRPSEGGLGGGNRRFVGDRFVFGPDRFRIEGFESGEQSRPRRGAGLLGKKSQTGATAGRVGFGDGSQFVLDFSRGSNRAGHGVGGCTVGIVEIEDGRLGDEGAGGSVGKIAGVSFQLGGTALMGLGKQRYGGFAQRHRCGKIQRQSGDDFLNGFSVRQNMRFRATAASGEAHPAQGEGGGHQFEKFPTVHALKRRGTIRELPGELFLKTGGLRELVKTAPVFAAGESGFGGGGMFYFAFHRWQPVQLCGGLILLFLTNSAAHSA